MLCNKIEYDPNFTGRLLRTYRQYAYLEKRSQDIEWQVQFEGLVECSECHEDITLSFNFRRLKAKKETDNARQ